MAYLLHIDTATDQGLYFLAKDGHIISRQNSGDNRDHAATLPFLAAQVLTDAGLSFADLSAIVVNGGPGSYTGLRIGLAAAKGYCFARSLPLLLENRLLLLLETLRAQQPGQHLLAILPARSGEYFAAAMRPDGDLLLPPQHLHTPQLSEYIYTTSHAPAVIGTVQEDLAGLLPAEPAAPVYDPDVWAALSFEQYTRQAFSNLATAEPYYLKAAFTTQPRKSKT